MTKHDGRFWSGSSTPPWRWSRGSAPNMSEARAARTDLRRRVQSLLVLDDSFSSADTEPWLTAVGPSIGPYQVLSKLGAGGMGMYTSRSTAVSAAASR